MTSDTKTPPVVSGFRFLVKHLLRIFLLVYAVVFLREEAWLSFAIAVLLVALTMIDQRQIPFFTLRLRIAFGIVLFVITILVSPVFRSG